MMTKTVRGVVRNGRIETAEAVDAPDGAEVVAYIDVPPPPEKAKMITFGMFAKPHTSAPVEHHPLEAKGWLEQEWERSGERLDSDE
jgi:hypothetical protein